MKTKHITATTAEILVVELPEGARDVVVTTCNRVGFYERHGISQYVPLPVGNWELLGRVSELTEEQAKEVVDAHDWHFKDGTSCYMFRDYRVESEYDEPSRLPTALKSLDSLLIANGVYFENPYGEEPRSYSEAIDGESATEIMDDIQYWREAQTKAWNKSNAYIFKKI